MRYLPNNEYSPSGEWIVGVLGLHEYPHSLTHVTLSMQDKKYQEATNLAFEQTNQPPVLTTCDSVNVYSLLTK